MSLGLLRAAWRPDSEVCVVRAVARQREVLLAEQASWVQRMQKALVQMNVQLTEVLTDVMGVSGQAIIRAIVAGERDAISLAQHRNRRVKASKDDVIKALTGNWREEHLFVLGQALSMYDDIGRHLADCDAKLRALLAERSRGDVELGKAPRAGTKTRVAFDLRQTLADWASVDLTRINGLDVTSVMKILSELGPDLSKRGLKALLTRGQAQMSTTCRSSAKPTRQVVPSPGSMDAVRWLMRTMLPTTVFRCLSSKATFSPMRKSLRVARGACAGSGAGAGFGAPGTGGSSAV